ncbi:hypothetical protein BFP71_05905 [Roseivirga misakiensis]|uniref:Uncharacterized protein n=1 Tax=Roseivirga misakiensis TaxID=1563681 RepID=A0A1E5T722_9BACT|nr:hypothetical protein BFP71_05905 [Roseivirga misakiensis]
MHLLKGKSFYKGDSIDTEYYTRQRKESQTQTSAKSRARAVDEMGSVFKVAFKNLQILTKSIFHTKIR